eukprot:280760_1
MGQICLQNHRSDQSQVVEIDEEHRVDECESVKTIANILSKYHTYLQVYETKQRSNVKSMDHKPKAYKNVEQSKIFGVNYDHINFLNDCNHLMSQHSAQFENIYNILLTNCNNGEICNLSTCFMHKRNRRNRDKDRLRELYFTNNHNDILFQQLIDRIHDHYFHPLTQPINDNIQQCETKDNENNAETSQSINYSLQLSKFMNKRDKRQAVTSFSYGWRYFYWDYYMHSGVYDDAHWGSKIKSMIHPVANSNYTIDQWYICNEHYKNFKQEIVQNKFCGLSLMQWNNLVQKAEVHFKTDKARGIYCPRKESAKYYDLEYGSRITKDHLIAMMAYCNYTNFQSKFSETYRHKDEADEEMIVRHEHYYFMGKLLRENVECFGMNTTDQKTFSVYHGTTEQFQLPSIFACVKGPLSTTMSYAVAVNFATNLGMILEIELFTNEWKFKFDEGDDAKNRLCCFNCQWLSDHIAEQEIFFIGGLNNFSLKNIIDVQTNRTYETQIKGIKQATYN